MSGWAALGMATTIDAISLEIGVGSTELPETQPPLPQLHACAATTALPGQDGHSDKEMRSAKKAIRQWAAYIANREGQS